MSMSSRPARSASISRSASAGCRAGPASRSTGPESQGKRRRRFASSPRGRKGGGPPPSSPPRTPPPPPTTGGQALKFYASVRLDIRRIGAIKDRDQVIGNQTRVKVVKNKMAPPFKVVDFDIMYGEGISKRGELIDLGVQAGVVEKSGAWFSYDHDPYAHGRRHAKLYLKEHPEIGELIERAIRGNAGHVADAMT